MARDVCVGWDLAFPDGEGQTVNHVLYVVGSTDDPDFAPSATMPFLTAPTLGQGTFQGPSDGFLAVLREFPSDPPATTVGTGVLLPETFAYWGAPGEGHDGLTGVNCWNEFGEHVAVTGWHAGMSPSADIGATTFFLNTAFGPAPPTGSTAPPNNNLQLLMVRDTTIGGTSDDRPTRMGLENATEPTVFAYFGLDRPEGGGVAVRNDGRIHTVGYTNPVGGGYPFLGGGRPEDLGFDAVRTVLDMVPPDMGFGPGVGRTDGSGFQGSGFVYPMGAFSGGTTPLCGLRPFGRRVGEAVPPLQRMLIDYEGAPPAVGNVDAAILLSRPPTVGAVSGGVLSVTLTAPAAQIWPSGVELWLDPSNSAWVTVVTAWTPNRPFRLPLWQLQGAGTMTVQFLQVLDPSFASVPLGTGCSSVYAASPAMFFSW